jgi:hypothetical protein
MAAENENNDSDLENRFSPSFDHEGIPACLEWSPEDVAEWIEYLGFPQYKVSCSFVFFVWWRQGLKSSSPVCVCSCFSTAVFLRQSDKWTKINNYTCLIFASSWNY